MTEFQNLGAYCAFSECKQMDFLPVQCLHCHLLFCKLHSVAYQHRCEKENNVNKKEELSEIVTGYDCSIVECNRRELTQITCHKCHRQMCLQHRLPDNHACESLPTKKPTCSLTPQEKVTQAAGRQLTTTRPSGLVGRKSKATSSKVIEMKLKMKATGNKNIPPAERVYFNVKYDSGETKPLFFSKQYSVGKIIDDSAQQFKLKNENHLTNSKKLRLFTLSDTEVPLEPKLEEILTNFDVLPFGDLVLKYV